MKFVLKGDWPVQGGAMVVPEGTLLEWEPPGAPMYRGVPLPTSMPPIAMAMDQASYDAQVAAYTLAGSIDSLINTLRPAAGVKPKRFVDGRII